MCHVCHSERIFASSRRDRVTARQNLMRLRLWTYPRHGYFDTCFGRHTWSRNRNTFEFQLDDCILQMKIIFDDGRPLSEPKSFPFKNDLADQSSSIPLKGNKAIFWIFPCERGMIFFAWLSYLAKRGYLCMKSLCRYIIHTHIWWCFVGVESFVDVKYEQTNPLKYYGSWLALHPYLNGV